MLEQIHATAEDQRKMHTIILVGMLVFAIWLTGWTAFPAAGLLLGSFGAVMLNWVRHRAIATPKRLAL